MIHGRQSRRGFTLIEVMVAIAIMTVGAVGLLSMQNATLIANRTSRQMAHANAITRMWIQRLKSDAQSWTTQGVGGLANTDYLTVMQSLPLPDDDASIGWFRPIVDGADPSVPQGFNWYGQDTSGDVGKVRYCVHINLTWVRRGSGDPGERDDPQAVASSIRADVRTFWIREGIRSSTDLVNFYATYCDPADPNTLDLDDYDNIRTVRASTLLRWMPR